MILCTSCGKENTDSFNFCLDCGVELKSPVAGGAKPSPIPLTSPADGRTCPACRKAVPEGFTFCGACGARVAGEAGAERGSTQFLHAVDAETLAKPKARLVTIRADGSEGLVFTLGTGETPAGRTQGIVLFPDDPYVSPRHCRFYYADDQLHVEDLGSRNGVFLRLRSELALTPSDELRVGRQLLRLEPMGEPQPVAQDGTKLWGAPDPGFRARLVQLLEGGGLGEVFPLREGPNLIGREHGDLTFPSDGFVSGRHAQVVVAAGSVKAADLGSSNGTFVRLTAARALTDGDFLLIGNQLLRVDFR